MTTGIRPFSNGTEYSEWIDRNCENCVHVDWDHPDEPEADCPLLVGLSMADWSDGTIDWALAYAVGLDDDEDRYCRMRMAKEGK
jgi:hypothetical protein